MPADSLETLVALCKRRGFIFPSGQVYGGLQGMYDYGPMGVELKNNLKNAWWQTMVYDRDDIEGLDSAIITHRQVLNYSGHVDTFTDPMSDCRQCQSRWRSDHLTSDQCPACGSRDLTEPRAFNLMFETQVGPVKNDEAKAYLRPETAQGIFANFKHVLDARPRHLPFGIAQIGKAFRNEITPRQFIFRVREFEQMELEYFVQPGEDDHWHDYWIKQRQAWWQDQGLASERLSLEQHAKEDLSHYAKATTDILYAFPHGVEELEGIANRTDFDLLSHSKDQEVLAGTAQVKDNQHSTMRLAVQHPQTGQWQVPFVIEPSAGVDRGVLAILNEAYREEDLDGSKRIVLGLKPHLAPIKVAVIPLAKNKPKMMDVARDVLNRCRAQRWGRVVLENSGNIGKSYRRHDEVGTPCCVTIDFATLGEGDDAKDKGTVTVRDRDTLGQERVLIHDLVAYLNERYFAMD